MTLQEALKELKSISGWVLIDGQVRHDSLKDSFGLPACPLCVLCSNRQIEAANCKPISMARALDLSFDEANMIVSDADGYSKELNLKEFLFKE